MPAFEGEVNRSLARPRGRERRVPGWAEPEELDAAALVAEVHELSEQLVVAQDALRLQQEELERARQRLETLTEYCSSLFESASAVVVLTDQRGVVLQSTRAAADLMRQPVGPFLRRPFTTWFDIADRGRVRSLVSGQAGRAGQVLEGVLLRRTDGSTQLVDVTLRALPVRSAGGPVLRWQLTTPKAVLRIVPSVGTVRNRDLAADLTELAARLGTLSTVEDTLQAIAEEGVRLVPGADQAFVVEVHRHGVVELLASSATAAGTIPGSAHLLTVPLRLPGFEVTHLRLVADRPLSAEAADIAELLAVHFRLAVARVRKRENLERALETRQLIGQAVGVLVERRRLTAAAAFEELVQRSQLVNLKLREIARIVVETGQDPDQISPP
jgi:PAS domain-containing protein